MRNLIRAILFMAAKSVRRTTLADDSEGGQVLLIAAFALPVMLGFTGIALDVGMLAIERSEEQRAVDAAALAGALVLLTEGDVDEARIQAEEYAEKNGYTSSEVTIRIPPMEGDHVGDSDFVEAIVTRTNKTFFMRVLGIETATTVARAVGGIDRSPRPYALIVLHKTKCAAYDHSSSANLTINGGGAIVNSSCGTGSAMQSGGSTVTADGSTIDYYSKGKWVLGNNAEALPPPTKVGKPIDDPLASLSRPFPCTNADGTAPTGCNVPISPDSGGTATHPAPQHVTDTVTLRPGVYYGGLKVTGSGVVTFEPGLYVFAGGGSSTGGFNYSGTASLSGTGVTFFNTSAPSATSANDRQCGGFSLQGSGSLSFTAPTTGIYKNMLFWQSDSCTEPFKYSGSSWTTAGVIYLPKAELQLSGGGALGAMQIIVDTFSYSGSIPVTINYTNYVPTVRPKVSLVE